MIPKEEEKDRVEATAGDAFGSGDPPYPPPFLPQQYQYQQQHYQYGTFGTPGGYYQPAIGFHQNAPSAGISAPSTSPYYPPLSPYSAGHQYFAHGYQAIPGYAAFPEGTPLRMPRLPCCGLGIGWFLFILGFFLAAVPWYVGAFVLVCARIDYREKPGFVACAVAAIITAFCIMLGATKVMDSW